MPELPEVETTRCGIDAVMTGHPLHQLVVRQPALRWPVPAHLPQTLAGHSVLACQRRGKYLLIRFEHGTQIVHLGMSGSLRRTPDDELPRKHDHIDWIFDHATLRLHDPRRFGAVLWHPAEAGPIEAHPLLAILGMEPFDPALTPEWLHGQLHRRSLPIKQALLGGHIVVGVGNIYASESLFRAGIHPALPANRLSRPRCARLLQAIRDTLGDALRAGGTTLRDYVGIGGEPGYFQFHAYVYERDGQPCRQCGTAIRRIVQGTRATYFCPHCQPRR
ncbi:bifunctional DNA-formamidopyrimidine glycosylase/DNA-(apurinic or apyrimidinic site) lyase [Corticimicrobacter populi]|uniref:Formamidopyrimidine-DNA glycosylase n=1 Tax=Corticimicrobacter populi TaxID=2175229 RepID=A0A2V1JZD1_9BURK|nr:bifunctional DNA-formamidopyrimidine glycosylase/DNA-(apurinic or apyrimidinic site) lyase [Corticimicrobacter populi]PWF22649.1 formamidopyrimidine-DNA glycosylase [Corticimicrobacter populi]